MMFGKVFVAATVLAVALASTVARAEGDPEAGMKVFNKCKACHVVDSDKHRVGPSLQGVIGRAAGTADGYKFSKAMVAYGEGGAVWDEETLNAYLESPRGVVKGTKMAFPGLKKEADRANVITYLMQATN